MTEVAKDENTPPDELFMRMVSSVQTAAKVFSGNLSFLAASMGHTFSQAPHLIHAP
jgi:hypothetical protein